MDGFCDKAIRCLCSCLIKKQTVRYAQTNEQHSKFMSPHEHHEDDPSHKHQPLPQQTLQNKLSDYLGDGTSAVELEQPQQHALKDKKQSDGSEQNNLLIQHLPPPKDYSDVISEQHPYHHVFKDKIPKLSGLFDPPTSAANAKPDTAFPLQLYCYQEGKNNSFVYFFTFPTDADTYQSISNDFDLQKKLDPNVQQFKKQYEVVGGDAKLIYLSYKKVLMMSSRDFQYVKYSFVKDNQHWSISSSDMSREQIKGKVRGEMVLTATRIIEVEGQIQVSVYSQVDMKMPIKMQIAKNRGFAQIRKYLDKVYNHIKNTQKSIL